MVLATPAEAIARTRRLLDLPACDAGSAWRVRRLDGGGVYYLVRADERVACVDAGSGELLASAHGARDPVAIAPERARALAAMGADAVAELVWTPCAATMSMFDPLWAVTQQGRSVYVDQRGGLWPALSPGGPGG